MGRPMVSRAVRREFWRLIAAGVSTEAAAAEVGVALSGAKRWFVEAGGMSPIDLAEPCGRYLSLAEREEIACGLAAGSSVREISESLRMDATVEGSAYNGAGNRIVVARNTSAHRLRMNSVPV